LGIRYGLSILSIVAILVIGFSLPPAFAGVPTCSLFDLDDGIIATPGNVFGGIDPATFSCVIDNGVAKTVTITETWILKDDSYVFFDNMDIFVDYTVTKIITNSIVDGPNFPEIVTFSYELHDPDGNFNDVNVPDMPCAAFPVGVCPKTPKFPAPGFSHSNDPDGLSFSQGTPIPTVARSSVQFATETPDEFNLIDFVDWSGADATHDGIICNTITAPTVNCPAPIPSTDTQVFGLRDDKITGENQAYLLRQTLTPIAPPVIGGEMLSSDFAVLAIAGMKDNAFSILGILSLVGVSTFAALYFTVKRK